MSPHTTLVTIACIYNPLQKTFLLTKRKEFGKEDKDYVTECWNFPGGGIQFKEDPEAALIREVKEELSADVNILALLPRIFSSVRHNWHGLLICYLCTIHTAAKITLNHESESFGWFTIEEIEKLPTLPHTSEIAKLAQKIHLIKYNNLIK